MQRIYLFEIYATHEGERVKMTKRVRAEDDLSAFTWLCSDNSYQSLRYNQDISVNMTSKEVPHAT